MSRWYNHIKSYTAEFDSLPGSSTAGKAFIRSAETKEEEEEEEKEEKEDDNAFNLFESDDESDEEAARIRAETLAAYHAKKAAKPKVAAKVLSYIALLRSLPRVRARTHTSHFVCLPRHSSSFSLIFFSHFRKSIVTIDIKPWDDTADLPALEKKIRTIEKQGLVWGQSKIIDIGFGAQKLQIGCVAGQ